MNVCRRLVLLTTVFLLSLPLMASAQSLQGILSQMSNEELLQLNSLIDAELALRGLAVTAPITRSASIGETLVWIPNSGSKYHKNSTCSGMSSPSQVGLSVAKQLGYSPCKRCKPPN